MEDLTNIAPPERNQPDEVGPQRNGRYIRAALKRQALKVSQVTRAGKFERVSTEFLENIEAIIEAKIRGFELPIGNAPLGQVDPDPGECFLTGVGKQKLFEAFNLWIAREIHRRVNDVRVGKTL